MRLLGWLVLSPLAVSALSLVPPAIPLAVKSPYLNIWLSCPPSAESKECHLASSSAKFWPISYPDWATQKGFSIPWTGLVSVYDEVKEERKSFVWMGDGADITKRFKHVKVANQTGFEFTATSSIFNFSLPVDSSDVTLTATFLTPVLPHSYQLASLPFSALTLSLDGAYNQTRYTISTSVDLSGLAATGDRHADLSWEYGVLPPGVARYAVRRAEEIPFAEVGEQAEWGETIWGYDSSAVEAKKGGRITTMSGPKTSVWSNFVGNGEYDGTQDTDYRAADGGSHDEEPVFAFAWTPAVVGIASSGKHAKKTKPKASVTFAIGHVRHPYVTYVTPDALVSLPGLSYPMTESGQPFEASSASALLLGRFLHHFAYMARLSSALDKQIRKDAHRVVPGSGKAGEKYAQMVELSTRQAMATWEFTKPSQGAGTDVDGKEEHVWAFLKEISSNGDMSTIDVIFPLYPILTYLNPELLRILLEPIMVYSNSGLYPNKWTVHDIGRYPNATGHNDGLDEPMPVEEAGNILWMILAYVQASGNTAWAEKYYNLLTQWTVYLTTDGLVPAEQLSTDDFSGVLANQTNLAVKAIVGIGAMSEISRLLGKFTDWVHYRATAKAYVKEWTDLAITTTIVGANGSETKLRHAKLAYQDENSWGTLYNAFGDVHLGLDLFPKSLYKDQDAFYQQKAEKYGVPLDSRHFWAKTDWEMFAAACATSEKGRDIFIEPMYDYLAQRKVNAGFPDLYETITANFPGREGFDNNFEFIARPVVGGHYALLARDSAEAVRRGETPDVWKLRDNVPGPDEDDDDDDSNSRLAFENHAPLRDTFNVQQPDTRTWLRWD